MTRYDVFEQLKQLTALTKTDEGYSKFIQKGEIEFYEYNRGFFDVNIFSLEDCYHRTNWLVRIWLGTIDDGDYGAWSQSLPSKEEADKLVDRIANDVFKDMVAFPTLEQLNILLRPYGMMVKYE